MEKLFEKPEKIFLIICLFWGFIFLIINPPFQASDETAHFWKTYALSQGSLNYKKLTTDTINGYKTDKPYVIAGDYLPKGIAQAPYINNRIRFKSNEKTCFSETEKILNIKLDNSEKVFQHYYSPAYTPISYFPQFILMKILTVFDINPGWILYCLRICSLFVYSLLAFWAIKISAAQKWMLFLIALLPMSVYQAAALNTDGITNGLCFLTIAYFLKLTFDSNINIISNRQLLTAGILITLTTICKFAYFPLLLMYFLIPKEKFDSKIKKYTVFVSYFFLNTILIFIITHISMTGASDLFGHELRAQASAFLINNPFTVLFAVLKTSIIYFDRYLNGIVGLFGWQDTRMPSLAIYLYILFLIFTAVFYPKNNGKNKFNPVQKIICAAIFITSYLLVFLACFVVNQIDVYGNIVGVSGRYFIAVLPLLFIIFNNNKYQIEPQIYAKTIIFAANIILFISAVSIFYRYYI
ncbi:MAG: DUF2142 domain-containing protein [Clostridium sp.]|nr:DUF2142 domain-containing protein [Clostridium sp.]